ncbi:MAG: hypothetical protein H0T89_34355 [Deltaproteobacteria bacterium]|nr:hypothetical protein [Deltaproteobacteria bacterium]MDQ3297950.1 hypothetical protein [Myxococcota bacterium]
MIGPGVGARAAEKHTPAARITKPSPVSPEARSREGVIIPAKRETPVYEITDIIKPVKYKTYEDLGLGKPKKQGGVLAKGIVSVYRLLGFGILTLIVVVLVGYIAQSVFFYLNKTWIAPVAISPTDEKVIAARTQLSAAQDVRDRTAAELAQAELTITTHKSFQAEFAKAIRGDRNDRMAALSRLKQLAGTAAAARSQIHKATNEFASSSQDKMAKEWEAGLIDRQSMLSGKFQIAQISGANLSLAEKQAEYEARAAELAAQASALEGMVSGKGGAALSYDVLKIKREYEQSRLELAKALGDSKVLKASLARQDQTINDLQASAYLRAMSDEATVALVPYENLEGVKQGTEVYACRFGFMVCREVGQVAEVLRGEVSFKHPRRDAQMRGQMVEVKLKEGAASKEDILYVGKKPLGV